MSQRGRAMLRVVENFAKSIKVTGGHWNWYHSKARVRFSTRIA